VDVSDADTDSEEILAGVNDSTEYSEADDAKEHVGEGGEVEMTLRVGGADRF
jgi:hypothetical protein